MNFPFTLEEQMLVWKEICGPVDIGDLITSPFRPDKIGKCFLSEYNGIITFKDFAYPKYNKYTCIHAVSEVQNVSYTHAISLIRKRLDYGNRIMNNYTVNVVNSGVKIDTSGNKRIWFEPFLYKGEPSFTKLDVEYWSKRGVSKTQLESDHVFSLHHYYIIGQYKKKFFPEEYPCYAYYFPDSGNSKLYFPTREDNKFISTANKNDIWKWEDFPPSDIFIITKSYKDGRMLKNIFPDIDIYAFQNEGVIPDNLELVSLRRKGLILYDNDRPGIEASERLAKYLLDNNYSPNVSCIRFDKKFGKDVDEVYLNFGKDPIIELITSNIKLL